MTILGFLSVKKFLLYLCPIRITREGDEEVRSTVVSHVGHGILRTLMHVPGTTGKARRQYYQLVHVGNNSIVDDGIPQKMCIRDRGNSCKSCLLMTLTASFLGARIAFWHSHA